MKKFLPLIASVFFLFSCSTSVQKGQFTVTGELKNTPDQKIYLEELYFSQKDPAVLDTAEIKNGKFSLTALAPEEGLYRLRLEKSEAAFIFINDQPAIPFSSDLNSLSLENAKFNSPANYLLRSFMVDIEKQRKELEDKASILQQYKNPLPSDSTYQVMQLDILDKQAKFQQNVLRYIDTTSNAVMALFSLGYTRDIEPEKIETAIGGLTKRFPTNQAIATIVAQYKQLIAQNKSLPKIGGIAPDITMADTSGKAFSLSMLRGKYVLVDFWASWCGPCREENPNVVNAYQEFKNKNFTVLGVSLDKQKAEWTKAVEEDHLTWYHISDLKYWNSAAVAPYGIEGIPYNVLLDPQGKIIAMNLRGNDLQIKLRELIK
jgi:peroxiredoxin